MLKMIFFAHFDCKFQYSIIESLNKIREIAGFIPNRCVFTKKLKAKAKNLLKQEPERIEAFRNTVALPF